MLPAYIPDLEIHIWQGDGSDVLADSRDGGFGGGGGRGGGGGGGRGEGVEGFDSVEEGGFAGVVEAEEEDGVFCCGGGGVSLGFFFSIGGMRGYGGEGFLETFFGGGPEVDGFG